MNVFQNTYFKHPNLRIVTQTPIIKYRYQTHSFFWAHSFQCLNTENYCLNIVTKQALNFLDPRAAAQKSKYVRFYNAFLSCIYLIHEKNSYKTPFKLNICMHVLTLST